MPDLIHRAHGKLAAAALFFFATGCAHQPRGPEGVPAMERLAYERLIKANTRRVDRYSGLYQTFQADFTILTTEVTTAGIGQRARFLQWDQREYQQERDKALQEASAYAKFFLRFYSPKRDYDDLHKGKSIWKIYLLYGNSRFEGKVQKLSDKFVEVQTLYPHVDRFSTPYEVTFNLPMATVEQGGAKVTMTSSLGTAEFDFPSGK